MSSIVKLYMERFYGVRKPVFHVYFNNTLVHPLQVDVISNTNGHLKEVLHFQLDLQKENQLRLEQSDKTNSDLLFVDDNFIDHYIKIREVEVDGIKFETALYFGNSEFRHCMPDDWVNDMESKGYKIDSILYNQTDIRLNGVWTLRFNLPIWQWVTEHMINFANE